MTDTEMRIIKALQRGISLMEEPFREIAQEAGVSEEELLAQVRAWKNDGIIRRFGAVLEHRRVGCSANAMGVWNVPDAEVQDFGRSAARFRAVSHCYQRPRFGGFRYNLYTMIHGRSREECEGLARRISERTGVGDYALLYTTAEFKKSSPAYFADAE